MAQRLVRGIATPTETLATAMIRAAGPEARFLELDRDAAALPERAGPAVGGHRPGLAAGLGGGRPAGRRGAGTDPGRGAAGGLRAAGAGSGGRGGDGGAGARSRRAVRARRGAAGGGRGESLSRDPRRGGPAAIRAGPEPRFAPPGRIGVRQAGCPAVASRWEAASQRPGRCASRSHAREIPANRRFGRIHEHEVPVSERPAHSDAPSRRAHPGAEVRAFPPSMRAGSTRPTS